MALYQEKTNLMKFREILSVFFPKWIKSICTIQKYLSNTHESDLILHRMCNIEYMTHTGWGGGNLINFQLEI